MVVLGPACAGLLKNCALGEAKGEEIWRCLGFSLRRDRAGGRLVCADVWWGCAVAGLTCIRDRPAAVPACSSAGSATRWVLVAAWPAWLCSPGDLLVALDAMALPSGTCSALPLLPPPPPPGAAFNLASVCCHQYDPCVFWLLRNVLMFLCSR